MGLTFFLFFPVLNRKINCDCNSKNYCASNEYVKSFHLFSSYSTSFGVTKYAIKVSPIKSINMPKPDKIGSFSATRDPIIPAVKTYLAKSAKILATTFLLSLLIITKVYHKKETI